MDQEESTAVEWSLGVSKRYALWEGYSHSSAAQHLGRGMGRTEQCVGTCFRRPALGDLRGQMQGEKRSNAFCCTIVE